MTFEIKENQFCLDGQPVKIISGAVHYFRNLPQTWDDIFAKLKAIGCNCVETYCAWNMHEKKKGEFDFTGILDLSAFLKKSQEYGLLAIVRPGPYICAEWEFGGLPWWLQVENDMEIRCINPTYMSYFSRYLTHIFDQVRPHLTTSGGNVIMMQVENEYGYYGDDKEYLKKLVALYREGGIDVPLFTSDGSKRGELSDGTTEGCLSTLNFGSKVNENFAVHDELFPSSPKMCMEMWNGWFDAWGDEKHHTTSAEDYARVVDDMLTKGSLNMYMFIGGTNFGFTSGANHYETFAPDVTSYDYDAMLTECGDVTEKYLKVREVIQKHTGILPPPIPKNRAKKAYGTVSANGYASLFANLDTLSTPRYSEVPKCMEENGIGYGYLVYQTTLNRDYENAVLSFDRVGDRAQIYVDDALAGIVYVNDEKLETVFSAKAGQTLRIVVENMGRTNFGAKMMYKKGLVGRCLIDAKVHFHWQTYPLPMDNLDKLGFSQEILPKGESFYRFALSLPDQPCDTFLKLDNFRKGFVVVNGFHLGRYWEIGPQKTLYVPAGVLKQGENDIVVFESDGLKGEPLLEFTDKPELG